MKYLKLVPIALTAAAAALMSRDCVAQTAPSAPLQVNESPLTLWTFPDRDAVNAGTVSIITAPAWRREVGIRRRHGTCPRREGQASHPAGVG
jgi:hypothetical protein